MQGTRGGEAVNVQHTRSMNRDTAWVQYPVSGIRTGMLPLLEHERTGYLASAGTDGRGGRRGI
jgi:hypothetical protein